MTRDIPILMLAAGASRRMRGRDKLLESVDGIPLLRRQVQRAMAATDADVFVTLPPAPHPRYDAVRGLEAQLVEVADASAGMSASLRAGIAALGVARAVMVALADMPEITTQDMQRLLAAAGRADGKTRIWRGCMADGTPGHPIVFTQSLWPDLMHADGDFGGREVVARHRAQTSLVPLPDAHAVTDLDTPEDWDRWRARQDAT
ncbi:nucleotidyltransferase family protein [Sulfitobacter sp. HNIBRBA3233]|uniref:nucleotidyltransferase family protein n=1 Tax=Sulfitobacter marinivivus TaxID=3158558 RepID=UPI0032DFF168